VPSQRRAPTGRNIRGHSYIVTESDVTDWRSLRISTVERLWCELGESLSVPDLVAAGDHLIHRPHALTSQTRLVEALERYPGRRGIRRLNSAIDLLDDRAESAQESRLRVIMLQAGISGVAVNLPITTTGGSRYRVDLAIPRHRLVIEYQGDVHRSVDAFRADMTRASRLEADGWKVVFVNANDLKDPPELITRIRRHQPVG
jgi:very-short-patch-repair endonuclease